jgi:chromosome partitioning protein
MATAASNTVPVEHPFDEDKISRLHSNAMKVLKGLQAGAKDDDTGQKSAPTFQISKAAQLVGRSASAIREAEKDGRLPARERTGSGHRVQYTLEDLDNMREVFGTRPWRDPGDPVAAISISNFKGGVGKSTTAVNLAQYLSIRGYRVLLVDCDSQASTTMLFGYTPDRDLGEQDTLYGYLHDRPLDGLRSIIRKTHFHNLHLIPANLRLYNLEYEMAAFIAQNPGDGVSIIDFLANALVEVEDDYDVIVMDPPPALGMMSMGVMQAANAMIIPMPPSMLDFSSTTSFLDMLQKTIKELGGLTGKRPVYNFVKVLGSKVDESKSMQTEILKMARSLFGDSLLRSVIKTSAEIDNASSRMKTVYELDKPVTSYEVYTRCINFLNAVNEEIEQEVLKTWPSRAGALL